MALFLRQQGYEAFALQGGFAGWREAGYPTESQEVELATELADICPECGAPREQHAPAG